MNKKEALLVANMLSKYGQDLSFAGCNDWEFPGTWTDEEKRKFISEFHEANGDQEEFDPDYLHIQDNCACYLLERKMREHAKEDNSEQVKYQFDCGWVSAISAVRKLMRAQKEDTGEDPDAEQVLAILLNLNELINKEK